MNLMIELKQIAVVFLVTFGLACFELLSAVQAVSPPPDGGYAGGNTAEGQNALLSLTTGHHNTAVGYLSLRSDATGSYNTAIGAGALLANTADENTATGFGALISDTTGFNNTANGALALFNNTTGSDNTANGVFALFSNTTSPFNTAIGVNALSSNTTGSRNTAIGVGALGSNTAGSGNTALGYHAGSIHITGDNNLYVGNPGLDGESNTIRLGSGGTGGGAHTRTFIAAVRGVATGNNDAIPVLIDSAGQLGTMSSSRQFKKEIRPMEEASETILALKPVTFHYKSDKTNRPEFGLIAEEVAEVNPDLVVCDEEGKPYSVRYEAVNAMLLNEFLKEHRKVQELEANAEEQQKGIKALATTVKEQAAQIDKVSAQLTLRKFAKGQTRGDGPAPQTVLNGR